MDLFYYDPILSGIIGKYWFTELLRFSKYILTDFIVHYKKNSLMPLPILSEKLLSIEKLSTSR